MEHGILRIMQSIVARPPNSGCQSSRHLLQENITVMDSISSCLQRYGSSSTIY